MKKGNAIIWRKSIYDNNFVCKCGEPLMKDGEMNNAMLFDEASRFLICPKCKLNVALLSEQIIEVDDDADYKLGKWEGEFR